MPTNSCDAGLIRQTKSTCVVCQKEIDARIVEQERAIFMLKDCPEHGPEKVVLSYHPAYYKIMNHLYFNVYNREIPYKKFFLYFTNKCNLTCPICYLDCPHKKTDEMSLPDIEEALKRMGKIRCILHGAEPTAREDLLEIIQLMNKYQGSVDMFTNGIKLADKAYVQALKDAKVGMIYLQFDGFDREAYKTLRGRDLLDEKMRALENLNALGMPIVLIGVIGKGVNDGEIEKIIKFAASQDNVKAVTFIGLSIIGGAGASLEKYATTIDECVNKLELLSQGRLSRNYLRFCQKINYIFADLLNMRVCYFFQQYILFKNKGNYTTLNDILDTQKMEQILDTHAEMTKKGSPFSTLRFVVAMIFQQATNLKSIKYFLNLSKIVFFGFCGIRYEEKSGSPLIVTFHDGCDRYKLDLGVVSRCDRIMVYKENGVIHYDKSIGNYFMDKEVERLDRIKNGCAC
ncbi:MAG: radical SAM protein [Candidatus Omnitrophica bacterium]|nr:radical SAM protein [Candidatus Omnitrophota bacterium]